MIEKQQNGIKWLEFELLSELSFLKHAIFLRSGGVSQVPYFSLNLGSYVEDKPEWVEMNLEKADEVLKTLDPHWKKLIWAKGCHKTGIAEVDLSSPQVVMDHDALITSTSHLTLMNTHADCQIAFIVDPIKRVIANVHAGWKGNVANIYEKTILYLKTTHQSDPANLLVGIGPSLGPSHSEFINYKKEFPEQFWKYQVKPNYFDLWQIAEAQCLEAGILSDHLQIAKICTFSNPKDYFSFRRDKTTGRNGSCLMLI